MITLHPAHAGLLTLADETLKHAEEAESDITEMLTTIRKTALKVVHPAFKLEHLRGSLIAVTANLRDITETSRDIAADVERILAAEGPK